MDALAAEPGRWMLYVSTLHPQLVAEQHLCASIGRRTEWEFIPTKKQFGYSKIKAEWEYRRQNPDATPLLDRFKSKAGFSRKHLPPGITSTGPRTSASSCSTRSRKAPAYKV